MMRKTEKVFKAPKMLLKWFYSASFALFFILLLAFNVVTPIDTIVQSKVANNLAFNAIVIIMSCVVFAVFSLIAYSTRIFVLRVHIQDIPKKYIPTHDKDLPVVALREIRKAFKESETIRNNSLPNQDIQHPGMFYRKEDSSNTQMGLLNGLIYEDIINTFGARVREGGFMLLDSETKKRFGDKLTLREYIHQMKVHHLLPPTSEASTKTFIDHYEKLRFSGKTISERDFFMFLNFFGEHTMDSFAS
ncbi:BA75_01403T0 [Komagataella pastoris]|uniref:Defect at low temperature protein 1 n=1 Tax=Komagataella pastoris TaxID=4922 RepID=A0A1B2J8E2_PICPA|nr:BA75_01403T0 [Komagataella pastoris]